ncbi:RNA polymerase sigma factor [Roseovarius rhodophyticola]|uniref:RNA polymerase sigma factor n=1 Tax=Roseovarius rhodophyticola TaxID=3080827 RepID=A0ABZ2TFC2_9RHOB|nr:RNA polymerase sigma factor [Roseovarius sp. W115]MDV2930863.1 RNA polymerase sigma factor [Roseovarius sp. W115]
MLKKILNLGKKTSSYTLYHKSTHYWVLLMDEDFSDLLVQTLPKIRRFTRSLTGNFHDADDLAQETVTTAIRNQGKWVQGSRFDSWVYKIAQNLHISNVRRSETRKKHQHMINGTQSWIQGGAEAHSDLIAVANFMRGLPAEQQAVIHLVSVEGYSYAETAEILNISIGTVTSRLSRGRAAIQRFHDD